ncbi:transporter family-2 protein [Desulfitispora alkaliphila]|uniref:DMT family transporter n=1 Tax=Desulfitispora alkaliphila TaxID=622674 RepID=UPI003D23ACA4
MSGLLLALLLSLLAGLAISFQGTLNTLLSKSVGILESTLVVHLVGFMFAAVLLVVGVGSGSMAKIWEAPKISLTGGLLGVIIVSSTIFAISKLGVSYALALVILAQLMAAGAIDHFGLLGVEQTAFTWKRALGVTIIVAGVFLMKK